jgi:outer membrane immunogenic protein
MKKFLIASTALAALIATPALAADMALKAPPPPPAPVCIWCGWYVGGNAGGAWLQNDSVQTVGTPAFAAATFAPESVVGAGLATSSLGTKRTGFIGGAQIGYNYQLTSTVIGFEADIQGIAGGHGSNSLAGVSAVPGFPSETFSSATTVSKSLDYLGTVRGRFGVLANPNLLLYGTGGLAYGGVKSTTNITQSDTGILPGPATATYSGTGTSNTTRAGWTLGGGFEWMLGQNWSAKVEYLYYNLGKVTYGVGPLVANAAGFPAPTWVVNAQSTTRFDGNIVRVGLDYHFGGPK